VVSFIVWLGAGSIVEVESKHTGVSCRQNYVTRACLRCRAAKRNNAKPSRAPECSAVVEHNVQVWGINVI